MFHRGRATSLVLLLLLQVLLISVESDSVIPEFGSVDDEIQRIELQPDPDSIRGVSPIKMGNTEIAFRQPGADTVIGSLSTTGWDYTTVLSSEFTEIREDLHIVALESGVDPWEARLALDALSDVKVRTMIPPTGFLLQGASHALQSTSSVEGVIASTEVPVGLVVDEPLRTFVDTAAPDEEVRILITGWRDIDGIPQLSSELQDHQYSITSVDAEEIRPWGDGRVEATVSVNAIPFLAHNPAVAWISFPPQWEIHNDRSKTHMRISDAANYFISDLNGSGVKVAVADSGIDQDHGDMNGRISYVESLTWGDSSTEDRHSGHGTHVACTVLGDGSRGGYAGVAPQADLYFQAMEDDSTGQFSGASVDYMLRTAYNDDVQIHTNSWGSQGDYGRYTTSAADVDSRTSQYDQFWSYDGFTVLYSAGNDGSTGLTPPATAKNSIAVANHHNRGGSAPDTIAQSSSKGPTDDGRIKPDLAAPGTWVRSCLSQDAQDTGGNSWKSTWYIEYSGTSMASPNAAGAASLVYEYLTEVAGRPSPQGALIKALLVLGAEDMGSRDIPNNNEGWGRINLANSLIPGSDTGVFVDDRTTLRSGGSATYEFNLTRSGSPLKVVLAWSDYQGSSSSNSQLRNDLNLEVTAPDGTTSYLGNAFQSGRSAPGGSADNKNNLEVVLVDSAVAGVWQVRISDVYHGGGRADQPFALAVRGVNVNDLRSDPIVILPDVTYSSEVPQVGEQIEINVPIMNQGSGTAVDLVVDAGIQRVGTAGTDLGRQTIGLGPGQTRIVSWMWTPQSEGDVTLQIIIDPDGAIEEADEDNNIANIPLVISAPGIRLDSTVLARSVTSADQASTTWDLRLKNTALLPTNATIESGNPIRDHDGQSFDWFRSFNRTVIPLQGSESTDVSFTLVHPSPPEPGTYRIPLTGVDEDNSLTFPLDLQLIVPILPDVQTQTTSSQISLHPVENTSFEIILTNRGNGPQGYDLRIDAPQSWHMGFDDLGSTIGASGGSSGTMAIDESITVGMTAVPPYSMISAGTVLQATVTVTSQVDPSESWTLNLPMVVAPFDRLDARLDTQVGVLAKDASIPLQYTITNTGNREVTITPDAEDRPSGWSISNNLESFTLGVGEEEIYGVGLVGNGFATSGLFNLLFRTSDGYEISASAQLTVEEDISGSIAFSSILLADGTLGSDTMDVGPVSSGEPGFRLEWLVTNDGSTAWSGTYSLDVPPEWSYSCIDPGSLSAGVSDYLTCSVVIPDSVTAGSIPAIGAMVSAENMNLLDIVSIRVASVESVDITTLTEIDTMEIGSTTSLEFEIMNDGNVPIQHRVVVTSEDGWSVVILDDPAIDLNPGSSQRIDVEVTPTSRGSSAILVQVLGPEDVMIGSIEVNVYSERSSVEPTQGGSGVIILGVGIILIGILVAAVMVLLRKDQSSPQPTTVKARVGFSGTLPPPPTTSKPAVTLPKVSCWACSQIIEAENRRACPDCGARYHAVGGCEYADIANCRRCGADSISFMEEGHAL